LVRLFQQKYSQANYSLVHLLKSMTFFEDADRDPMPEMLAPITWPEVKSFFLGEVPRLL